MSKQLDIYGNEVDDKDLPEIKKNGRRFATMQEMYGKRMEYKCQDCKHCKGRSWRRKTYYKCELWVVSNCSATDIRLKNHACRRFELRGGK